MSALLDGIAQRIGAAAGEDVGVAAVIKFDAGQDGVLVLDTTSRPAKVSTTDRSADCTIKIAASFLMMAVDGRVPIGAAFMKFVRGVQGAPGLAVQIQPFLRKVAAKK
ncbi:MAG TPA: SCP2 sterol-binding domain-containing protein [Stellaceae bacterium]|nr:SCP2 sterol-binding domain-containing protein [Stellaceae bacterium]